MANSLRVRPFVTVILAISADGKIADRSRTAARFGSPFDKAHLERQIAQVDGVLFGSRTLKAYGTTLRVVHPDLLQQRQAQSKPLQPVQIVCSRSANLDPKYPFFQQPVPRWLLTTATGAEGWRTSEAFEWILVAETETGEIAWEDAFHEFTTLGIERLAVLGGGELVSLLLAKGLIDEFWLTLCPLILGGVDAPTPVEGAGFLEKTAPRLQLLAVQPVDGEVFLHYKVVGAAKSSTEQR